MTVTQRVNLVRNAEEHIRALTAVIDFLVQSPIFGSDDQLVKILKDGTIAALIVQDPFRMGYDGVKIALAAFSQRLAMKVIAAEVAATSACWPARRRTRAGPEASEDSLRL